jgi:hypothetical protein
MPSPALFATYFLRKHKLTHILTKTTGSGQLAVVFSILLFFICCFSIIGMAIYQRSFFRFCVSKPRPIPACWSDDVTHWRSHCNLTTDIHKTIMSPGGEIIVSGGYPFVRYCKIFQNVSKGKYDGEYPYDEDLHYYHTCGMSEFLRGEPVYQTCIDGKGLKNDPHFVFSHFDHFGGALVTIFQVRSCVVKRVACGVTV